MLPEAITTYNDIAEDPCESVLAVLRECEEYFGDLAESSAVELLMLAKVQAAIASLEGEC